MVIAMQRQSLLSRAGGEAGFTLAELVVAALVSALLVGGAVALTSQVQRGYGQQLDAAASEEEARYALDWIQRLLRQAGSDPYNVRTPAQSPCLPAGMLPSVNGFPAVQRNPLGRATVDNIRIFADSNPPDGLVGGPGPVPGGCNQRGEDVTISLDRANRTITMLDNNFPAEGAVTMTDDVVSELQFDFMDRNRWATTNMATVAWVRVTVTTQATMLDPHLNRFVQFPLTVDVRLRPRW
jgi:type IV pilus assembly protein PilW